MNIQNSPYFSTAIAGKTQIGYGEAQKRVEPVTKGFGEVFTKKLEGSQTTELKFSKHAQSRLEERNINLSDEQLSRLSEGASKAGGKGIKESLVMIDDLAFIVSIPSRTVITAVGSQMTDSNIFTNIDGAVIN